MRDIIYLVHDCIYRDFWSREDYLEAAIIHRMTSLVTLFLVDAAKSTVKNLLNNYRRSHGELKLRRWRCFVRRLAIGR